MSKAVTPSLGLDSYSCPHCGALAHQYWRRVFISGFERGHPKPTLMTDPAIFRKYAATVEDKDNRQRAVDFASRFEKNLVTFEQLKFGVDCHNLMTNTAMAWCHSCEGFSIWVMGNMVYPENSNLHAAHEDMPSDVKLDFEEAASIVDKSPKGAAALLRLALQKLMVHLDEKGENLNTDIGNLVAKGLDPVIQQALDVVRVVGNNAVHPGQIELNDDPTVAGKLFVLVNIIVTTMISAKKQIGDMFAGLPDSAKKAIEKRDTTKSLSVMLTSSRASKDGTEPA